MGAIGAHLPHLGMLGSAGLGTARLATPAQLTRLSQLQEQFRQKYGFSSSWFDISRKGPPVSQNYTTLAIQTLAFNLGMPGAWDGEKRKAWAEENMGPQGRRFAQEMDEELAPRFREVHKIQWLGPDEPLP